MDCESTKKAPTFCKGNTQGTAFSLFSLAKNAYDTHPYVLITQENGINMLAMPPQNVLYLAPKQKGPKSLLFRQFVVVLYGCIFGVSVFCMGKPRETCVLKLAPIGLSKPSYLGVNLILMMFLGLQGGRNHLGLVPSAHMLRAKCAIILACESCVKGTFHTGFTHVSRNLHTFL